MKVYGYYTNTTPSFTRLPLENVSRSVKCSGGGYNGRAGKYWMH